MVGGSSALWRVALALLLGDWAVGALAFGSAVLVPAGAVVGGKDRAVGWALVVAGAGVVQGVLGHLISGVET